MRRFSSSQPLRLMELDMDSAWRAPLLLTKPISTALRRNSSICSMGATPLGQTLNTFEAVGAVPDAAGLTELSQPVFFYSIPGVSGEAEGLGKSRGP